MLVYDLDNNSFPFEAYKDLMIEQEINKLDILTFEIPAKYIYLFKNEYTAETENQKYVIKNIEPYYNNYRIECKQDISDWYIFHESLNFPYKSISDVLNGIKPNDWQIVILDDIEQKRTITADHKMSSEVIDEVIKKYKVEVRYDNKNKKLYVGYEIAENNGVGFAENLNLADKDIKTESFEFATRIIPEGMNGLMINQVNDGKKYLENNSYSPKTITYYWKDERYTNIQNLKEAAQKKLDLLSKPYKTIEIKVQDLSKALETEFLDFKLGDYVYLLNKDKKVQEFYRILRLKRYENQPLDTEITLNNKPIDLVEDEEEFEEKVIELTTEMWEQTRVRFETTEDTIRGFVESQKRYTDDSFKTYKTEREQTDKRIYEKISETTTYVDPKTGQTKPIVDKQLEVDKTLDGIKIDLTNFEKANNENIEVNFDNLKERMDKKFGALDSQISTLQGDLIGYKQSFDIANGQVNSEISAIRREAQRSSSDLKQYVDDSQEQTKQYVSENYSSRKQTDNLIQDKVMSLNTKIVDSESNLKRYVEDNYSTIDDVNKKTAGLKKYVEENYSSRTQTDNLIEDRISTVKTQINDTETSIKKYVNDNDNSLKKYVADNYTNSEDLNNKMSDVKKYVETNYSTRTQTNELISDKVGSVIKEIGQSEKNTKKYIEENYSTREQTTTAITSEVSAVRNEVNTVKSDTKKAQSKADSAYSKAEQTANGLSTKVSKNDVISSINQSAEKVKIDAKNIDLTGDVDIVGSFKTSSYGRRVEIKGSSVYFYDYSDVIGSIVMSSGKVTIQGPPSSSEWISLGQPLRHDWFTNFSATQTDSELMGSWYITNLDTLQIKAKHVSVDTSFKSYQRAYFYGVTDFERSVNFNSYAEFNGSSDFNGRIRLGTNGYFSGEPLFNNGLNIKDNATISTPSSGSQVWITQKSSGLSFVIDYNKKSTFFA